MSDQTLLTLWDDVRTKTLDVLKGLDDVHARWAPPNLQNSCLWHAGHNFVVAEFLASRALGVPAQLPENWLKMFSWESNPAHIRTEEWPPLAVVTTALSEQHRRLREVFAGLTPDQLDAADPGKPERSARRTILIAMQDEARHIGEVMLLRKMMTKTFVVAGTSFA
ncbi:DinB family protein [Planctomyces sp. SH-PL62]|uniref:DinB family protein n=1 Tax=Planctomyces sp. SH-PL62 TaxID=1636152 RepID=UPI00078BF5C5|nr:DinB family protein [Planctomyces sp. SH-PL62]AMV39802.1 DinB superfamily protein [Planctomyces sp. SH-PL62]